MLCLFHVWQLEISLQSDNVDDVNDKWRTMTIMLSLKRVRNKKKGKYPISILVVAPDLPLSEQGVT